MDGEKEPEKNTNQNNKTKFIFTDIFNFNIFHPNPIII